MPKHIAAFYVDVRVLVQVLNNSNNRAIILKSTRHDLGVNSPWIGAVGPCSHRIIEARELIRTSKLLGHVIFASPSRIAKDRRPIEQQKLLSPTTPPLPVVLVATGTVWRSNLPVKRLRTTWECNSMLFLRAHNNAVAIRYPARCRRLEGSMTSRL